MTSFPAYAALVDITLAMLPWKVLWGLQVKTGEKIGVALAMSMGVLCATPSASCLETGTNVPQRRDLVHHQDDQVPPGKGGRPM